MRKTAGAVLAAFLFLGASPAWADHGEYEDERGDCRDSSAHCEDNDFSPSFQDSPVRDAFNFSPTICLPGSTCNVHEGGRGEEQPAS